jgi:hypothetical protein
MRVWGKRGSEDQRDGEGFYRFQMREDLPSTVTRAIARRPTRDALGDLLAFARVHDLSDHIWRSKINCVPIV